jgi:hypothetical protein
MNDDGTDWEEQTVRAFFHEEVAETVLQIPISRYGGDDFVSWMHDKHGQYTVRSAYNLARTATFFSDTAKKGGCSDRDKEESLWKSLWAIQTPSKMKIVSWRAIHDCLPTGHQLTYRHIPADDRCVFCGRVEHLFLMCPFARAVWDEVKVIYNLQLIRKNLVNFKQWFSEFILRVSDVNAMVFTVVCWQGRAGKIRGPVQNSNMGPNSLENLDYLTIMLYICVSHEILHSM